MSVPSREEEPQDVLRSLEPYDSARYAAISLAPLATYAVKLILESGLPATQENVVVALYRLFPDHFSLMGYPEYPDAARVGRTLLQCQPKYRNYLHGGAKTGYRLTHQGEAVAEETTARLQGSALPKKRRKAARGVADQFMREVTDSPAFAAFQTGDRDDIRFYDITRILHATPASPRERLGKNLKQLLQFSRDATRSDVETFIKWVSERFEIPIS